MAAAAAVEAEQNLHRSRVDQLTGMLDNAQSKASAAEQQLTTSAKEVRIMLRHQQQSSSASGLRMLLPRQGDRSAHMAWTSRARYGRDIQSFAISGAGQIDRVVTADVDD